MACALAAAAACASSLVLALASPAGAATVIEVDAGYAGTYIPGKPMPVRVRLSADRLISSELQVIVDGLPTSVPVEVPGGSTKDFLVIVPTSMTRQGVSVLARLPDGSKTPPAASATPNPAGDQEVVGLSPGALANRPLPGAQPLAVDLGTARFVALSPADLDRAPDSLGALGTVGLGPDELARLAPSTRNGILQWVEGGGRLLIDASPGGNVAGLPDAWQPASGGASGASGASGATRIRAGLGEIQLTGGRMAAGRWSGLIEPTASTSPVLTRFGGFGGGLGDSLARDAGFRLPELSWLVAFLIVYVLLVGPVMFVLLRRRRRPELAWIAIPLVAVVFTGASWAGGRGLRNATQLVHGTVLSTGATGSTAVTYLGVSSRSGGTVRVGWPSGWLTGVGLAEGGSVQTSALTGVRATAGGPVGQIPLDANQFGLVSARGPSGAQGALEVTARADGEGRVRGTVRNATQLSMEGVAVFMGTGGQGVGPLAPGESQEWTIWSPPGGGNNGPPPEFTVFGENPMEWRGGPMGPTGPTSTTTFALWDIAQRAGFAPRDTGTAVAVGWTNDYRPPVRIGSRSGNAQGRTLVVGTAAVARGDGPVVDVAVRREALRPMVRGTASSFRFTLPPGSPVDANRLLLRTPSTPVEVWTGSAWAPLGSDGRTGAVTSSSAGCPQGVRCPPLTTLPVPPLGCPPGVPCDLPAIAVPRFGGQAEVALPEGAVHEGAVYVRFTSGIGFAPGDTTLAVMEKR